MNNVEIPEEAWQLLISEPSVGETERAASLIVAAELERLAGLFAVMGTRRPVGVRQAYGTVVWSLGLRAEELRGHDDE